MLWIFVFIGCAGILLMYRSWKFGLRAGSTESGFSKVVDIGFSVLGMTLGLILTIFGSMMSWGMVNVV